LTASYPTLLEGAPEVADPVNDGNLAIPEKPALRAGGYVLSLFAAPLNTAILRALANGPMRLADLRRATGDPPQTTLRGNLASLAEIGALEKRARDGAPTTIENDLTELGLELLFVADLLEEWLAGAPEGLIVLDSERAKRMVKALAGGWESTALRALAARPMALTELDCLIPDFSYPALERRLGMMRSAGLVEVLPGRDGKRTFYAVSDWARRAISPLAAAGRCELRHLGSVAEPVTRIEVEASFLLILPLVELPRAYSGSCLLAVHTGVVEDNGRRVTGVHVEVEAGRIVCCVSTLEPGPRTWALGDVGSWLDAVIDGRDGRLRFGGKDPKLALRLVKGIHSTLFDV
jgi:DNA-binding HxlR family transcriptional regulator